MVGCLGVEDHVRMAAEKAGPEVGRKKLWGVGIVHKFEGLNGGIGRW